MADLRISLGFDLETASIREVQAALTQAIRNVDPEIAVAVNQNSLNEIIRQVAAGPYTLDNLTVDPQARHDLSRIISEGLTIEVEATARKISPTRAALEDLKDSIESQLRKVDAQFSVQAQIEQREKSPRGFGPTPPPSDELQSQADEAGLSTKFADVQKQRLEIAGRRLNLEGQLLVVDGKLLALTASNIAGISSLTDAYESNVTSKQKELQGSKRNFRTIQRINEINEQLANNELEASEAFKRLASLRVDDGAILAEIAFRELAAALGAADEQARNFANAASRQEIALKGVEALDKQRQKNLVGLRRLDAIQERVINGEQTLEQALKEAEGIRTIGANVPALAASAKELTDERRRVVDVLRASLVVQNEFIASEKENASALDKIAEINRTLVRSGTNLITAQEKAAQIAPQGDVSTGSGKLVDDSQKELLSNIQRRITVQEQATASDKRFSEAASAAANELKLQEAAQKSMRKRATENARAIKELTNIVERRKTGELELDRAIELAARLTAKGGRGGNEALANQFNAAQEVAIRELEGLAAAIQANDDANTKAADRLKRVQEQAKASGEAFKGAADEGVKNQKALSSLSRIAAEVDGSLTSLSNAIKAATRIQSIGDASQGIASIVEQEKAALLQRLNADKQVVDAANANKILVKEQAEAQKAINKTLDAENKSFATTLGINLKQQAASEDIFQKLTKVSQTILLGEQETEGAFSLLARKIRDAANKIDVGTGGRGPDKFGTPTQIRAPAREAAGGGPSFSSAADVENFSDRLDTSQLREFAVVLGQVANGTKGAKKSLEEFTNSVGKGKGNQDKLNLGLSEGATLSQKFGAQVAVAGKRLLAWAAPSALIFNTISLLKKAVTEITNIDKEARRLVFFQNSGKIITSSTEELKKLANTSNKFTELGAALTGASTNIEGISKASQGLRVTNKDISDQFRQITGIARQYGISIGDATAALVEIARVGQKLRGSLNQITTGFTEAVFQLIRVEGGALAAGEAVRGLQAIQAQFFGGKAGTIFQTLGSDAAKAAAAMQSASNAAGILAATSAGSAASVSELIDATTRLGSAFVQLAGLNFPQTVAIIGNAFTLTGATTGRLATALRQTATLIAQNANEIEKFQAAGDKGLIKVKSVDGTIKGFESILDVLDRIRETAGTLESTELSLLIADRRNVADIQALAQGSETLRASFEKFADPVERINAVVAASAALFNQTEDAANGLDAKMNNLQTSFVEFVESEGLRNFLGAAITGFTTLVDGISAFSASFGAAATGAGFLAKQVGYIVLAFAGAALIGAVRGFTKGLLNGVTLGTQQVSIFRRIGAELKAGENIETNITKLRQAGLITAQQEETILRSQVKLNADMITKVQEAANLRQAILKEQAKGLGITRQEEDLLIQEAATLQQIAAIRRDINANIKTGVAASAKGVGRANFTDGFNKATGIAIAGAGAIGLALKAAGKDGMAEGVSDGLQLAFAGAAAGGATGAAIGAFAGVLKAIIISSINSGIDEAGSKKAQSDLGLIGGALDSGRGEDDVDGKKRQKALSLLTAEERKIVEANEHKIELNEAYLGGLRKQIQDGGSLTRLQRIYVQTTKAASAEIQQQNAEIIQRNAKATQGVHLAQLAVKILQRNVVLRKILSDADSSSISKSKAALELKSNEDKLQGESLVKHDLILDAAEKANIATRDRLTAIKNINSKLEETNVIIAALGALPIGGSAGIQLKIELDEETFAQTLAAANARLQVLEESFKNAEKGQGAAEAKKLEAERDNIRKLELNRIGQLVKSQQTILADANKSTDRQIKTWESAAQSVTKAFSNVIKEQTSLAKIFQTIGVATGDILERTSSAISDGLERSGVNIAARLASLAESTDRKLENTRQTFSNQQSTLGTRFGSSADISAATENLVKIVGATISKSDEEITRQRTGIVTTQGAQSRELARSAREEFKQRLDETRRAISIRRDLLQGEISLFQKRLESEKAINELRRSQQEEFGRLLIESPEKFKQTLDGISTATNFFKGITEINEGSLKTLQARSERLRQSGPQGQEALRTILSGIQSASSLNQGDIVGGIGNKQLEQIFTRVQRENTGKLATDLQEQKDELNSQTQLQREIDARQKALVDLAKFDATLQKNVLAFAQIEANAAIKQRDAQLSTLQTIQGDAIKARDDLVAGLNLIVGVLSLDPDIQAGGSDFEGKLNKVLKNILPKTVLNELQGAEGDTSKIAKSFVSGIQGRLKNFLNDGSAGATKADAERAKLIEARKKESAALAESIGKVNQFSSSLIAAKISTDAIVKATPLQRGTGLKDVKSGNLGKDISNLQGQLVVNRGDKGKNIGQARNKFITDEIKELKERAELGGQLTKEERNRLSILQKQSVDSFANRPSGGRQIARNLFKDDSTANRITSEFRGTLQDTQGNDDFIDRVKRLRGEGARGRRGIDVGATQKFLQGSGFEGAAKGIKTKGQAADVLDRFIEISNRLAKEQENISQETKKKIIQVLGDELVTGIREINTKTADTVAAIAEKAEKDKQARAAEKEEESSNQIAKSINQGFDKVIPKVLNKETFVGLKTILDEGGATFKSNINEAFTEGVKKISSSKIQVDEVQLKANVTGQINVAIDNEIGQVIFDALAPILGRNEALRVIVEQIRQALINANFKGISPIPPGGGVSP